MTSDSQVDPELLQRIKSIVRRDLKLGPSATIADEMPFFESDADLDSLDILLLVTSIEKEFGIKIPSAEVGRSVFENPLTLARYVERLRSSSAAPAQSAAGQAATTAPLLDRLPHRAPFRFVSRLRKVEPGQSAEGSWDVSGAEDFFAGHFPGRPVVPGVLIAEALAQLAGIAGAGSSTRQGALVHVDVRFESAVTPPASIALKVQLTRRIGAIQQYDVAATLDDRSVARGSISLHLAGDESAPA